jgi:hypothetical protein
LFDLSAVVQEATAPVIAALTSEKDALTAQLKELEVRF